MYVKEVYGRWVNEMRSIPEKAKRETSLTVHQQERLYDTVKEYMFTLPDNVRETYVHRYIGIRFSKNKPGKYARRYTRLSTGERKTRYAPCTLLIGLMPDKHKAVRHMISIKERVQYDFLNRYQPLIHRR